MAFVIAAVALVVLYRAAFDGVAAVALARREAAALDRAQSRLAALRVQAPRHRYVHQGADGDGFSFREVAAPLAAPANAALIPVRLTVTEGWRGRAISLTTIIAVRAR